MAHKAKQYAQKHAFEGQHDDESVLLVFRRHPIVMRKGLLALLVLLLIGMIPSSIWPANLNLLWIVVGALALGLLILFYFWIGWFFSLFIITDQRLIQITQSGLLNRSVVDVGLDKIQSVNYQVSGLEQTMFGFGTLLVQTYVGDMVLDHIHHPGDIQGQIVKIIKEQGYPAIQPPGLT
jgi:uncharacterized membrane protein YdbT with pleckstrin-like domain